MALPPNHTARCGTCLRELNNVKDPRSVDCGGHCLQCMADAGDPDCVEEIRKIEVYPQIAVLDFVRLMKDFLDKRIDVHQYCRGYWELNVKRIVVSEEESKILQQAFGDADDFDEVVDLEYISESQLRERVAASLERLRALGHPLADH